MLRLLLGTSAAFSIYYFGSRIAKDTASKIWEQIAFSVPKDSTKVKVTLTELQITTGIQIANNNNINIQVAGLGAIVKYKDQAGNMVEVGRTAPNPKVWTIAARQSTIIKDIQIKAGSLTSIKALINAVNQPAGARLMITFSGTLNGLPLSYDYWY